MKPAARIVNILNPTKFDYNAPTELSTFVPFFHDWHRFGRSNRLDFSSTYGVSIFLVALPFVIVAIVIALFASAVNLFHGGVKRRGINRQELRCESNNEFTNTEFSMSTNELSMDGCGRILGGVLMFAFATHLVGLIFVANHFFYNGISNVIDLSESAIISISTEGAGVLGIVRDVLERFDNELPPQASEFFNVMDFVATLSRAQNAFTKTTRNVGALTSRFRMFGNIAFWLAVGVYVVLVIGVLLLFSTAFPRRKHQRIAMSIFIVPFVISWFCVATITASATVAADLCIQLAEFQKIVLVQATVQPVSIIEGIDLGKNLFIQNNVQCPQQLVGLNIPLANSSNTLGNILQSDLATGMLTILYPNASFAQLEQVQQWLVPAIKRVVDCTLVTRLAGQYMFTFCGHRGPITALFVAWGSLLALAIILIIAYLLTQFSYFEVSRFLTPFLKPDEDIYGAFNDLSENKSEQEIGMSESLTTEVPDSTSETATLATAEFEIHPSIHFKALRNDVSSV